MMENKERKFTELFHHFKADTADIHPDVRRYNEDGVIAFGGELSYEPYDDNITVRVLFLKGISVRMALKGDNHRLACTVNPVKYLYGNELVIKT